MKRHRRAYVLYTSLYWYVQPMLGSANEGLSLSFRCQRVPLWKNGSISLSGQSQIRDASSASMPRGRPLPGVAWRMFPRLHIGDLRRDWGRSKDARILTMAAISGNGG